MTTTLTLDPTDWVSLAYDAADWTAGRVPRIGRDELRSQSLLVLVEACQKWDPSRSNSPKTYLSYRIRQRLMDFVREEIGRVNAYYDGHLSHKARGMRGQVSIDALESPDEVLGAGRDSTAAAVIARLELEEVVEAMRQLTQQERDFLLVRVRNQRVSDIEAEYGIVPGHSSGYYLVRHARKRLLALLASD